MLSTMLIVDYMHLRASEVNVLCAEDGEMGECWWERVVRCGEIGNAVCWNYMAVLIGGGDTICGGYTIQISQLSKGTISSS